MNKNFYYEIKNTARVYNHTKQTFKTMPLSDVYKLQRYYYLPKGYELSDKELKRYALDFFIWGDELKNNNIFKFDYLKYRSHESACIGIFKKLCHGKFEDMDQPDNIEYGWIQSANNSGLRYCESGKYNCHGYDFKLQFPSILASEGFEIPTKRGTEQTIKTIDYNKLSVGFYKVKVISDDKRFKKVFAFCSKNVYTNTSLFYAYQLKTKNGYDVNLELIEEENNCYIYGKYKKDNITRGSIVFGKWFKYITDLKEKFPKNQLVKMLASTLWGRLSQYNKKFKTDEELEEVDASLEYDINHEYYIRDIKTKKKGNIYEIVNCKNPFYYNIARIKPFLLAQSRIMTGKIAVKYIDDVIRICIDNVTFNKEHDDVIFEAKTFKLVKEDKTTGEMQFRRFDCYRNFTNEKYTTKHFYKNYDSESDDDDE